MRIRGNVLKNIVSIFSSVLLLINSFSPFLLFTPALVSPVKAQEVVAPADTVTPTTEVTPTDNMTPTVEATPTAKVTPDQTLSPAVDATITPTIDVSPTVDVSPVETITPADQPSMAPTEAPSVTSPPSDNNQSSNQSSSNQPTSTPTPSPVQSLITDGSVNSTVVNSYSCRTDSLNGCLVTDKADYAPTEIAVITGNSFKALTEYSLKITSDGLEVSYQITTDLNGSFTYSYQLDGTYRPSYLVQAYDLSGNLVAATTFLDHNNHPTATPTPTPTKPDLTAVKTNDVEGNASLNTAFNWKIKIQNQGENEAVFNKNEDIFSDYLPTSGATYGSVTVNQSQLTGNGHVSCSIEHSTKVLTCTAEGSHSNDKVIIEGGKFFEISFSVTPTAVGTLNNPRDKEEKKDDHDEHYQKDNPVCQVDPNDKVDESIESNNDCSDTVKVNDDYRSITIIKDVTPGTDNQAFTFTSNKFKDFILDDNGNNHDTYSNSKKFTDLSLDSYVFTEQGTNGWGIDSINCNDEDDISINNNVLTVNLDSDTDITCTFVNKKIVEEPYKFIMEKVVCDSFADLPHYGDSKNGVTINSSTAQNWVDQSEGRCHLENNWTFQYADATQDPGQYDTNLYGSPWTTISANQTVEIVDLQSMGGKVTVREVIPADSNSYVGFTGDKNGAELYCPQNSNGYDNYERLVTLTTRGETEYCVAFNALKQNEEITPTPGPAELHISKTNDASGEKNHGDIVTYTLTLTDLYNNLTNVVLKDLLPKGFTFQNVISIIKNGSEDMTALVGDPHYHSPGTYNLGDMNVNDVIIITYTAQIDGSVEPGVYKDLAWATGVDASSNRVLALAQPAGFVDTNYSGTDVSVGGVLTNTGDINIASQNGQVLGASTSYLPATGANNLSLILASILSIIGLFTMMIGYIFNNKKSLKIFKNVFTLVLLLLAFSVITVKTQAAGLSIRISQPKSPTAVNNFSLTFVVLDTSSSPANITVKCYKKGPNDGGFSQFAGDVTLSSGGNTDSCAVGGVMGDNGTYQFYATANNGSETITSATTSVDYNTANSPNTPFNYSKSLNNCQYVISFTTANDGVNSRVEIYRSKETSFNLDSSTRITSLNEGPNQNVVYTDNSPDCTQTWYYVVRAFNNLGVGSGTVGDTVTTATTTTSTSSSTPSVGAIPVGNGNVLGTSSSAGQNGQVMGAEASGTPEVVNVNNQNSAVSNSGIVKYIVHHKKISLLVVGLIAIIVGGVIWLKRKS